MAKKQVAQDEAAATVTAAGAVEQIVKAAQKARKQVMLNPADVVIDEAQNGRAFPYTDKEIYAKACTLKAVGQIQPVLYKMIGGKAHVVIGCGRALGAIYLNTQDPAYAEQPFLLEAIQIPADLDVFEMNVAENFQRKTLTPVDIAHNIARSDERLGPEATDAERMAAALALYGRENNGDNRKWVDKHRLIHTLPMTLKKKINNKTLAPDAALEYVGMDPDVAERVAETADADADGKKVTRKRVQQAARKVGAKKAAGAEAPVSHALSKPALVTFLGYQVEHAKKESIRTLCNALLGFLSGELPEPDMLKVMARVTVANPEADGKKKAA